MIALLVLFSVQEAVCREQQEKEKCSELAQLAYPDAKQIAWAQLPISQNDIESVREECQQTWLRDTLNLLVVKSSAGIDGYAVVDDVRGKDQLITYLVIVSSKLVVKSVEIISYRESFGGEIRNHQWRNNSTARRRTNCRCRERSETSLEPQSLHAQSLQA
jgi:hypothetical protein